MNEKNNAQCLRSELRDRFAKRIDFSLINEDTSPYYELYTKIKEFLFESSTIYPSISDWWETRVLPGLKSSERFCQTVTIDGEIAALSIVKRSKASSKLCTLKVHEKYRGLGIGQYLLHSTFLKLISINCNSIHFTISEDVMNQCGSFFTPYGFALSTWKKGYYVKGMDELIFSSTPKLLMKGLIANTKKTILLSIKPEYAEMIEQGAKLIEFRRKFSPQISSAKALFYVSRPAQEIRFTADICEVIKSRPDLLWAQFNKTSGVDFVDFSNYFKGASEGNALVLSNIKALPHPLPLDDLKNQMIGFNPPQSYRILQASDPLFRLLPPRDFD